MSRDIGVCYLPVFTVFVGIDVVIVVLLRSLAFVSIWRVAVSRLAIWDDIIDDAL